MEHDQETIFKITKGLCCFEGIWEGAKEKGAVEMSSGGRWPGEVLMEVGDALRPGRSICLLLCMGEEGERAGRSTVTMVGSKVIPSVFSRCR